MNMKKILMFFLLMASISSFSQESLTIDEALSRVGNNKESYEFKSFENTKEATDIRIKDNKLGDFNGVTLSSGYNISENNFDNRPRKYDRTFQNKATYGPFFVNYNYVQSDRSYVSFGIEKNLKDVFYSKYNSNLKINNYQQELNKINYDKNIQTKKLNLVSLYQDILNTKNELEYRRKAYEHYKVDLDKFKKSYELGASPKINLESAELEAEDSKLQIDILETKLKSLYEIGKTDYNIDFENYKLVDFIDNNESIEKLLANYMEKDIAELKLNLSVAEERKKYSNYDRHMPDLYLAYERVDRNLRGDRYYRDQDIFSIRFSKKLFSGISTTTTPSRLEVSEVIFFKSDSEINSHGKFFCKGFKKSCTKKASTMRKSELITSRIAFLPSTKKRPSSCRVFLSARDFRYAILFFEIIFYFSVHLSIATLESRSASLFCSRGI